MGKDLNALVETTSKELFWSKIEGLEDVRKASKLVLVHTILKEDQNNQVRSKNKCIEREVMKPTPRATSTLE